VISSRRLRRSASGTCSVTRGLWWLIPTTDTWSPGTPCCVRCSAAAVPVRDILLYDDCRDEREVVTFTHWLPTVVDGDPDEWRRLADEHQNARKRPLALAA
jgi:hypothetical protein